MTATRSRSAQYLHALGASGARTADLQIGVTGASAMRLEAWVSGTQALANAIGA